MTHFINNAEFEIIEQKLNNNWIVCNVDTGEIREISDYYLRNIHQDDYEEKSEKWLPGSSLDSKHNKQW